MSGDKTCKYTMTYAWKLCGKLSSTSSKTNQKKNKYQKSEQYTIEISSKRFSDSVTVDETTSFVNTALTWYVLSEQGKFSSSTQRGELKIGLNTLSFVLVN